MAKPLLSMCCLSLMGLWLTGCAENFSWSDQNTWRLLLTEDQRVRYTLERACVDGLDENDYRVLSMNGISGHAVQTNCLPYTRRPLPPQRFEGR